MEFLFLHLCTRNRNNVRLEALIIDPCAQHFGMLLDGNAIVCAPYVHLQLTGLSFWTHQIFEAVEAEDERCKQLVSIHSDDA
jgi:hypothetical protein